MRRRLILGIALLCGAASQAPAYDLSQHEWRHRLLFLIAPQSEDAGLKMQRREIALQRDAVLDRDVLVFQLLPDQALNLLVQLHVVPGNVARRGGMGPDSINRSVTDPSARLRRSPGEHSGGCTAALTPTHKPTH